MCGVPYHAVDSYLSRLVEKGYRLRFCEQVEDPKKAKGLVKREVIRVVTPGTTLDATSLDEIQKQLSDVDCFSGGSFWMCHCRYHHR